MNKDAFLGSSQKTNNKKRILVIDGSIDITGAYKSITTFMNVLDNRFDFFFATSFKSKNNFFVNKNVRTFKFNFIEIQKNWKLFIYLPFLLLNSLRLKRIIKENNIDIVHINDLYNMCGVILKFFTPSIKVIYHVRLLPSSYVKCLYFLWKWAIEKYADEIICVSETTASNFNNKTTVIYDTVPGDSSIKSNKNHNKNIFTILYLANYIPGKGHKQAIESYNLALNKIPKSRFIFYGGTLGKNRNGLYKDYLRSYAKSLGLEKHITFNELLINPVQEIAKCDLMLNFSESESFSMTTLEALTYGVPIIATKCGGPEEIIENNFSGLLIPVNDIKAMTEAIINLANDESLRNEFIKNGQKRASSKFNIKEQKARLSKLYSGLLNTK